MDVVVDTNVLFSFFNERSYAREISLSGGSPAAFPVVCIGGAGKTQGEVMEKFSLNKSQFDTVVGLLKAVVEFVQEEEYLEFIPKAVEVSPDADDSDFFALALKLGLPLWSNDKELKRQSAVKVFSTKEMSAFLLGSTI